MLESLPAINDFIFLTAEKFDVKQDILKVQLAVEEACTNIIKHAYSGEGGIISLSCEKEDDALVITIRDNGRPFDPASIPPPDLEAGVEDRQIGKLGLHFMKKLMDEVTYRFDPERGNTLIMKKKLG